MLLALLHGRLSRLSRRPPGFSTHASSGDDYGSLRMMFTMRTKRGAPLSKVVLAIALGVGRHAMAHAHGHHHHLSSGGSAGHAAAPAPAPPGNGPGNGRGAAGGACAVLGGRAVYDLMVLCHENGWRFEPYGDRYLVTTGTSAAAERGDGGGEDEHKGEEGVSGGAAPRGGGRRAPPLLPPPSLRSSRSAFSHNSTNQSRWLTLPPERRC